MQKHALGKSYDRFSLDLTGSGTLPMASASPEWLSSPPCFCLRNLCPLSQSRLSKKLSDVLPQYGRSDNVMSRK